jgi:hypothetical protein
MYIQRNNEAPSPNLCCRRKAITTKHPECVCVYSGLSCPAFEARASHNIVICGLFGSTTFCTLFHTPHDFRKTIIQHAMCVLIFSTTCVWKISHSKKIWGRYDHKCHKCSCKVPVILVRFKMRLAFYRQILANHHHKHQGLDPLILSVSRVTAALANVSSVF